MEMIRVYNRKTGEILEKTFTNSEDADNYEVILDFLTAEYERYHDGEMICASEGEEKFMLKCENCPYHYKGEDDDFAYCHFEGDYLAPCEEDYYEDKDCDDWDKYDEEEDY